MSAKRKGSLVGMEIDDEEVDSGSLVGMEVDDEELYPAAGALLASSHEPPAPPAPPRRNVVKERLEYKRRRSGMPLASVDQEQLQVISGTGPTSAEDAAHREEQDEVFREEFRRTRPDPNGIDWLAPKTEEPVDYGRAKPGQDGLMPAHAGAKPLPRPWSASRVADLVGMGGAATGQAALEGAGRMVFGGPAAAGRSIGDALASPLIPDEVDSPEMSGLDFAGKQEGDAAPVSWGSGGPVGLGADWLRAKTERAARVVGAADSPRMIEARRALSQIEGGEAGDVIPSLLENPEAAVLLAGSAGGSLASQVALSAATPGLALPGIMSQELSGIEEQQRAQERASGKNIDPVERLLRQGLTSAAVARAERIVPKQIAAGMKGRGAGVARGLATIPMEGGLEGLQSAGTDYFSTAEGRVNPAGALMEALGGAAGAAGMAPLHMGPAYEGPEVKGRDYGDEFLKHRKNVAAYKAAKEKAAAHEKHAAGREELSKLEDQLQAVVNQAGETQDPKAAKAAAALKQKADSLRVELGQVQLAPLSKEDDLWLSRDAPKFGDALGGGATEAASVEGRAIRSKDEDGNPIRLGYTVDQVEAKLDQWREVDPKLQSTKTVVHDSILSPEFFAGLPEEMQERVKRAIANGADPAELSTRVPVPGFYRNGQIHVLAPALISLDHLNELVSGHELTHDVIDNLQPDEVVQLFGRGGKAKALGALARRAKKKDQLGYTVGKEYADETPEVQGEEVLAGATEYAGTRGPASRLDQARAAVKDRLRAALPDWAQGVLGAASDAEIRVLLDRTRQIAAKRAKSGSVTVAGRGPQKAAAPAEGKAPSLTQLGQAINDAIPNAVALEAAMKKITSSNPDEQMEGMTELLALPGLEVPPGMKPQPQAQQPQEPARQQAQPLPEPSVDVDEMLATQEANDRARLQAERDEAAARADAAEKALKVLEAQRKAEQDQKAKDAKAAKDAEAGRAVLEQLPDEEARRAEEARTQRLLDAARSGDVDPSGALTPAIHQFLGQDAMDRVLANPLGPEAPRTKSLKKQPPGTAPTEAVPPTTVPPAAGELQPKAPTGKAPKKGGKTRRSIRSYLGDDFRERDNWAMPLMDERRKAREDKSYWARFAVPDRETASYSGEAARRSAFKTLTRAGITGGKPIPGVEPGGVHAVDLPQGGTLLVGTWKNGARKGLPAYAWGIGPSGDIAWAHRFDMKPGAVEGTREASTPTLESVLKKTDPEHPFRVMQGELAKRYVQRDPSTDALSKGGIDIAELLAPTDTMVEQFQMWAEDPEQLVGKVRFEDGEHTPLTAQQIKNGLEELRLGLFGGREAHAVNMHALDIERAGLAVDSGVTIRTSEDVYGKPRSEQRPVLGEPGRASAPPAGLGRSSVPSGEPEVAGTRASGAQADGRGGLGSGAVRRGDDRVEGPFPEAETPIRRSRRQEETPEFKAWFGKSLVTDEEGQPKVLYRGSKTANAVIDSFRGASYYSESPAEASGYALQGSKQRNAAGLERKYTAVEPDADTPKKMGDAFSWMPIPSDFDGAIGEPFVYDGTIFKKTKRGYEYIKGKLVDPDTGVVRDGNGRGERLTRVDQGRAVQEAGDEAPNTSAVYVRLENPYVTDSWDYGNQFSGRWSPDTRAKAAKEMDRLKAAGHDGVIAPSDAATAALATGDFSGPIPKNYIVFSPEQVKSATGNDGTFSRTDPDIRRSMRGASAQDADRKKLKTAQKMILAGQDEEKVRKETGWHQGTDKRWRWEGDDSQARIIMDGYRKIPYVADPGKNDGVPLGSVLQYDSMYRSYPEVANIRVVNAPRPIGSTVASFNEKTNVITLFPAVDGFEGGPLQAFLHEVQHWVQTKEAFAAGGNADTVLELIPPEDAKKIAEDAAVRILKQSNYHRDNAAALEEVIRGYEYHRTDEGSRVSVENVPDALGMSEAGKRRYLAATRWGKSTGDLERDLSDERKSIANIEARAESIRTATGEELKKVVEQYGDAHGYYLRLAGEEEARQTQKRANLTPAERAERDPRLDFDNPPERQIVDMRRGPVRRSRRNSAEAQLSWEAVPGMNTGRLTGIHDAPYEIRAAFTTDMGRHFKDAKGRDVIAPAFGLKETDQISVPGYYLNSEGKEERNPSRQLFLQLPDSPDAMDKLAGYAAARGYVLRQEAVGVHVARNLREGEAENGYFVEMGSVPTEAQYEAYVSAMTQAAGEDAFKFVAVPTHGGINLWTWDDSISPTEIARINDAASAAVDSDVTMQARPIKVDSRYIENDWSKEAPNGEGYIQQITAAGGPPDLQARLDKLRKAADGTAEEWAKRHGWGAHKPAPVTPVDARIPRDVEALVGRDVKSTGQTKRNLFQQIANVVNGKDLREMRLAAESGRAMKGWYRDSAAAVRKLFGEDTEAFVATLAALSPRQGVRENLKMAVAVWEEWDKRGRPTDPEKIREMFPRIGTVLDPETGKMREKHALVDMGGRIPNVVTALSTLGSQELSGAKVESFRRNLLGDFDAVTNDTWMAQFADISQSVFGKPAGYLAGSYMVRRVAKQLGWTPAEVQETVWTFFRELRARTDSPLHRTQEGHRLTTATDQALAMSNADVIRGADSFAHLVRDPNVRDRLQRLGIDVEHLSEPTRLGDDATHLAVRKEARDSRVLGRIAGRVQRASDSAWANKQLAISRIHKLPDADPAVLRDIARIVGVPIAGRSGPQIARALQAYRDPAKYSRRLSDDPDWDLPLTPPQVEARVARLGAVEDSLAADKPGYEVKRLEREKDRPWTKVGPEAEKLDLVTDDDQWVRLASRKGRVLSDTEQQAINSRVQLRHDEMKTLVEKLEEATALSKDEAAARGIDVQALVKEEMAARLAYVAMERASVNAGTQAGRALAARRRIMAAGSDVTPDAMLRRIIKELPDVDKADAADLYRVYHQSPAEFTNALRLVMKPGAFRKGMEYWKAGLLSGLGTHVANVAGNTIEPAAMLAETLVAAGIDKAWSARTGKPRERFVGEARYELRGQLKALPMAFSRFVDEFKAQILRQEEPDISAAGPLEYQVGAIGPGWGAIPFDVGKAVRTPFRALTISDRFFKALGYEAELYKLAYRQARKDGFVGEKADQRADQIIESARQSMGDHWRSMVEQADEGMKQRVFQGEPVKIIRSLMTLTREHPAAGFMFPFLRTPAEITRRGWQRSPMGLVGGRRGATSAEYDRQQAGLEAKGGNVVGKGEVSDAWARPLVGTALATAFSGLAAMGMLTGGGPVDEDKKKLKLATGWQPYSVRIPKGGGKYLYLPYTRFEPLSSLLGIVADAFETGDERKVGDKIMGSIAQNYTNKQFWKGLNDFATAITSPDRSAKTVITPIVASALVPAVVAKTAEAIDPTFREKRSDPGLTGLAESTARATLRRIPGVSRGEEPIYTPLGDPAQRPGNAVTRFASPVQPSTTKAGTELEDWLVKINEAPSPIPGEVAIPKELLPRGGEYDQTGTRIVLTNEERAILAKSRRDAASILRRDLESIKRMPLDDQRDRIQKAFKGAQREAISKLWLRSQELRERARKQVGARR